MLEKDLPFNLPIVWHGINKRQRNRNTLNLKKTVGKKITHFRHGR